MCTNLMVSAPSTNDVDAPLIHVSARCMEMPGVIDQSLYVMPSGQSFPLKPAPFTLDPEPTWLPWTSTYDFVGVADATEWSEVPNFNDGLNEKGLSVGALWLQPGTDYPQTVAAGTQAVSFYDFPAWVLGQCATVDDVRSALGDVDGVAATISVVGPAPGTSAFTPLHYVITDATGSSIVVEFADQSTQVYESTNAVMTNAPTYDWQMTNVANYANLSLTGVATSTTSDVTVGGQLLGLPGDSLPASRFIRAWYLSRGFMELREGPTDQWLPAPVVLSKSNPPAPGFADAEQTAVVVAMQLVQICMGTPYGMLLESGATATSPPTYGDYTMYTCVRDHTNRNYYFVNAFSGVLCKIDLADIDFASAPSYAEGSQSIGILPPGDGVAPWYVDVTSQLQPVPA